MANSNAQQKNNIGYYDQVEVVPRNKQVRKINNDFEYLNQGEAPVHASNDEIFNASYEKRGLQPSSLDQIEPKEAANDQNYNDPRLAQQTQRNQLQALKQLARKKAAKKAERLVLKTRVSAVNSSIIAWGTSLWFFVQLPFAVLSIVMLGVLGLVYDAVTVSGLGSILNWAADAVKTGVKFVTGVDLGAIADGLFFIPYIIVIAIGLITLFVVWFQYTLALLKPTSGEKSGLKLSMLLLAFIGYCVPVLNLFPWVLPWMIVVWKYPR